jgi:flagellar basal-body rod protein FlgF
MDNSLYIAISRQTAIKSQMNLVANNIANMNTAGYRSQNVLFQEHLETQSSIADVDDDLSLVHNYGQYDDHSPGPVKTTGNPLDIALNGPGFLGVVTPNGVEYTRAGNLSVNGNGELITASGFQVANTGGAPINIPDNEGNITIGNDGSISTNNGIIDNLMLAEFDNYQLLTPQGNGLYNTTEEALPAANTLVMQGAVEGSNVNPILEMTRMIEISKNYQSSQRFIQGEHDLQRDSIKTLSKVP